MILLAASCLLSGPGCAEAESNPEDTNMEQQVYTLGVWHVSENRHQDFINAWKELGDVFASLPDPPGKGVLVQSVSDPTLFYSFGPWNSLEAVESMRNDQRAREGIRKLADLCIDATPGTYRVVAGSP